MTQQKGVPKSIRFHRKILEAYRDGWLPYLEKFPWRIWVKRGHARRVYMSYGVLRDEKVIAALSREWETKLKIVFTRWSQCSERMMNMPELQLSILQAVIKDRGFQNPAQAQKVCLDIHRCRHNKL